MAAPAPPALSARPGQMVRQDPPDGWALLAQLAQPAPPDLPVPLVLMVQPGLRAQLARME